MILLMMMLLLLLMLLLLMMLDSELRDAEMQGTEYMAQDA